MQRIGLIVIDEFEDVIALVLFSSGHLLIYGLKRQMLLVDLEANVLAIVDICEAKGQGQLIVVEPLQEVLALFLFALLQLNIAEDDLRVVGVLTKDPEDLLLGRLKRFQ